VKQKHNNSANEYLNELKKQPKDPGLMKPKVKLKKKLKVRLRNEVNYLDTKDHLNYLKKTSIDGEKTYKMNHLK
jgi:hypothetical protein